MRGPKQILPSLHNELNYHSCVERQKFSRFLNEFSPSLVDFDHSEAKNVSHLEILHEVPTKI
ncbi:MAG: hypothetical protein GY820_00695 [Gammaproteobacteria bacterium]|nr:hypothetical protein [Gammaproteobacteria bacterium]